ncbi:ribonuclease HII [Arachidicoccus sp.]|uniref:ribonuclease HII n=1 Tax=Arachidicoccus sp. TaxID=1872624 RepID=UPI003D21DE3C
MLQTAFQYKILEAGCDEAGRGCYAGPVFAAAVVLPKKFYHPKLNDSKQVKEKDRNELRKIIEAEAIDFAVAKVEAEEIDKINILKASIKAMHLAIAQLSREPKLLLIDGNRFITYKKIEHKCIIKGDGIFANIAAASILAKTYRDEYMKNLHDAFPQYDWLNNKGYGTLKHRNAIESFGLCEHHRKSFRILPQQLDLF